MYPPQLTNSALCASAAATCNYTRNGLTWTSAPRMNHIQVIGTHNSYHIEPPLEERPLFESYVDIGDAANFYYSHPTLDIQLAHQSVRNLELDLFADPDGGHYATPLIRTRANLSLPADPAWHEPGIKVFHVADADIHTTCVTLLACLRTVKAWSDAHPSHVPIPFMIEFKEATFEYLNGTTPIPWDSERLLSGLDEEIRSVFPADRLVVPDDIRRGNLTLETSILRHGWPDLDSARGRVFFLMDNDPSHPASKTYKSGRPNLENRVLFTNASPGDSDCAFQKLNNPLGEINQKQIKDAVQAGYWVRTRADVPMDTILGERPAAMREAALASGAQVVSTDFQAWGMSSRWGVDYAVRFDGGRVARCNSVASGRCVEGEIEPEEYVRN